MATKRSALRNHVSTRIYNTINRRDCWHLDAWLIQDHNDCLFFVLESRRGGWEVLSRIAIRVHDDGTTQIQDLQLGGRIDGIQRHLNDPWASRTIHREALERVHWQLIQPSLRREREGFRFPYSVMLHYLWTDPSVTEPFDGIHNLYEATGRAEHHRRMTKGEPDARPLPGTDTSRREASPFGAHDRSILRTLDKLLR